MLEQLYKIIEDRKNNPNASSYTNELLTAGYGRIAQKVGEEAIEVIIAAGSQGKARLVEETSDLIYHLFVLLVSQEISLDEIKVELERRHSNRSQ